MAESKLTRAAQAEALSRPTIGGNSQDLRQVELERELNLDSIKQARNDLAAGKISLERFNKITNRK